MSVSQRLVLRQCCIETNLGENHWPIEGGEWISWKIGPTEPCNCNGAELNVKFNFRKSERQKRDWDDMATVRPEFELEIHQRQPDILKENAVACWRAGGRKAHIHQIY